jgi:hypothetical protein
MKHFSVSFWYTWSTDVSKEQDDLKFLNFVVYHNVLLFSKGPYFFLRLLIN